MMHTHTLQSRALIRVFQSASVARTSREKLSSQSWSAFQQGGLVAAAAVVLHFDVGLPQSGVPAFPAVAAL